MRIIYNAKHSYTIRLKFVDEFLTFQTKLLLKAKASICSSIEEIPIVSFWHLLSLS